MVYIIQCLCGPSRHCILGLAADDKLSDIAKVEADFQAVIDDLKATNGINPWCGICGSRDWHLERARSIFQTIEEATPHIKQIEQENLAARDFFQKSRN